MRNGSILSTEEKYSTPAVLGELLFSLFLAVLVSIILMAAVLIVPIGMILSALATAWSNLR